MGDADDLVRRAQAGDEESLSTLLGLLAGPLRRQATRLGVRSGDVDDVVQEALLDIAGGLPGYRGESSLLGWAYAICARRAWRGMRRRQQQDALALTEDLERWLVGGEDPLSGAEGRLVEQDAHLRCALAVTLELSPSLRRAYLLGEVLGVPDVIGAEALAISRPAFRQRVARARRTVNARIREAMADDAVPVGTASPGGSSAQLDRLVQLGQLHRAAGRPTTAEGAIRALHRVAPDLTG